MAQFEHLGYQIGPAEVQEEHARGQPHQATNKEPMRRTKLMSNRLTSEPEYDWTFFEACFSLPALLTKSAASPEVFLLWYIKATSTFF